MAGGNEAAAGTIERQRRYHKLPALLNQMSSEEFEETDEIQIEGCCNWKGDYFPVT